MHIPDGFLSNNVSAFSSLFSAGFVGFCFSKIRSAVKNASLVLSGEKNITIGSVNSGNIMLAGLVCSLVFSAQMFNFPISNGTSGHFLGGVFSFLLLGPYLGSISMGVLLIIQSIMFGDGGLLALGTNIFNMAFIGTFLVYYVYSYMAKRIGLNLSIFISSLMSVILAAFFCSVELSLSGTASFFKVLPAMFFPHFFIGLSEGIITLALINIIPKNVEIWK